MTIRSPAIICVLTVLFCLVGGNAAADLAGKRTILLVDHDNVEHAIGAVQFVPTQGHTSFVVELHEQPFSDHFLSMRPFKCIEGGKAWWCHLPYPYDLRQLVSEQDLVDLEYALLFISKKPGEFGIDAWNGRYYKLATTADGSLAGTLHEVDLNVLAAPPEGAFARPIGHADLTEADSQSQPYPKLIIR